MNDKKCSNESEMNAKEFSHESDLSKPLDIEEFRKHAHTMVDFIADYYEKIESFPVFSKVQPGFVRSLLPESALQNPDSFESVLHVPTFMHSFRQVPAQHRFWEMLSSGLATTALSWIASPTATELETTVLDWLEKMLNLPETFLSSDVERKLMPGLAHWCSPNFYAFFPAGASTASFLGEMLSSGLATTALSWIASPAATELETTVLDWLGKMLNLPETFLSSGKGGGVIQGSGSESILVSLLAARDKALKKIGAQSLSKLVVYVSDQTHVSVEKASKIAGIQQIVRVLPTDSSTNYTLCYDVVQEYILKDKIAGLHPMFLCVTIGTTSSTAVDPLFELAKIKREHDIWLHVDASYAGNACICPEYQHYLDGIEDADSFNMNPHKWLFTNFDCSTLWVKDSRALVEVLGANPEVLRNKVSESNLVMDYKDWRIPLGSRFRSLKLWMVLRLYGVSNLQAYIRNHINLAQHFENLVNGDSRFEVMAPRTFALVCFRVLPPANDPDNGYTLNSSLLDTVNNSGHMYISHTVLSGIYTLRFNVGAIFTEVRHVDAAWKVLQDQANLLLTNCNKLKK